MGRIVLSMKKAASGLWDNIIVVGSEASVERRNTLACLAISTRGGA